MPITPRYTQAENRLKKGEVLVLDAGVATELERRGLPMTDGVWSARAALDHFETVVAMHRAYIDAGADIITANTYASSRIVLEPHGLADQTREINTRSIEAAREARERSGRDDVLVAGSLSHFVSIPTGQSIQPKDDALSESTLRSAFDEMREIQEDAGVDVILLEMMSLPHRMKPLFDAVALGTTPAWCGYSVLKDESGSIVARHDPEIAFREIVMAGIAAEFEVQGVMHSAADLTGDALLEIHAHAPAATLMAYPDSGFFKAPNWQFIDVMPPGTLAEFSNAWIKQGAQIIGGCCGLGPEHTAAQRAVADLVNGAN